MSLFLELGDDVDQRLAHLAECRGADAVHRVVDGVPYTTESRLAIGAMAG